VKPISCAISAQICEIFGLKSIDLLQARSIESEQLCFDHGIAGRLHFLSGCHVECRHRSNAAFHAEVRFWRVDQQVIMVAHETIGVDLDPKHTVQFARQFQKQTSVWVFVKMTRCPAPGNSMRNGRAMKKP